MSMALPLYLAMTQTEFQRAASFPNRIAWMACHFSPYGTGLCDFPAKLPRGSAVILDDCIPVGRHDPQTVAEQLAAVAEDMNAGAVLLDFQREEREETRQIARRITDRLPCPVGVSEGYGAGLNCPIFLPPIPPDRNWEEYLAPYQGREIWLEVSTRSQIVSVTGDGAMVSDGQRPAEAGFFCPELLCRYRAEVAGDRAVFTLWRNEEDIVKMGQQLEGLGVTKLFGLYQELGAAACFSKAGVK